VANETVDYLKKDKKSGVLVKVDFEKAYDSVDSKFLYYMMGRLGFSCKWIRWIRACMESTTVSVLVNGSPTEEFRPKRGLRQGDPLAPFLFLIVAEGLTGLVREAKRANVFSGVTVGTGRVKVDLLQFANDTLFFCEPFLHNVLAVKAMLRSFEMISGLRVNFRKSAIGAVGISQLDKLVYSKCLNCRQIELPFKYLGITIGGNPRRITFWNSIVDKIKSRLSSWKGRLLSMAGRICLIKFVITALPLFYFSFFKAPIAVYNHIRRIQAKFLWGWGFEERKIAWVKWNKVCSPVEVGGLGIKDIECFNDALLAKWNWRYRLPGEGLWREILEARYGNWRNMDATSVYRSHSAWW